MLTPENAEDLNIARKKKIYHCAYNITGSTNTRKNHNNNNKMANQCMVTINGPVEVRGLRKTCVNIEALNASTFRGSCPCS